MSIPSNPDLSSHSSSREAGLSREAYTLLAQANLLRMRGRWDEAIKSCMAAMHLSPENATAQSLLGDIYDNRGCIDDAIQWYRMALDINPESPADKIKLARLLEAKGRLISAPPSPPLPTVNVPRIPRPAPAPAEPYVWIRAAAASTLIGLALVAIALFFVRRPSADLAALAAARQLSAAPLVLPTSGGAPASPTAGTVVAPSPSLPDVFRDPTETALLRSLQSAAPLAAEGIVVSDAQIDPRDSRVTLTLVCRPDPALRDSRLLVLRDAQSIVVQTAQVLDPSITQFTVRCLLPSANLPAGADANSELSLVYVADTTRAALAGFDDSAPMDATHLQSLYSNSWWLPSLPSPVPNVPSLSSTPPPTNVPSTSDSP